MTPQDLDLAAALRQVLRHPLLRDEIKVIFAEVAATHQVEPRGYLSSAEAARRAGVRPAALRAWIAAGNLAASKVPGGRGWRIRAADLEALLAGQAPTTSVLDLDAQRQARAEALAAAARKGR